MSLFRLFMFKLFARFALSHKIPIIKQIVQIEQYVLIQNIKIAKTPYKKAATVPNKAGGKKSSKRTES